MAPGLSSAPTCPAGQVSWGPGPPPPAGLPCHQCPTDLPPRVLALRSEGELVLRLREGCKRGSPVQQVPGGHCGFCAHWSGVQPQSRWNSGPPNAEYRDLRGPSQSRRHPQGGCSECWGGVEEVGGSVALPCSVSTPGAPHGTERPLAPCPEDTEGSNPLSCPFSVPIQVAPRPGEPARAASQVFRHLPPTEAAGRGRGPMLIPPRLPG